MPRRKKALTVFTDFLGILYCKEALDDPVTADEVGIQKYFPSLTLPTRRLILSRRRLLARSADGDPFGRMTPEGHAIFHRVLAELRRPDSDCVLCHRPRTPRVPPRGSG